MFATARIMLSATLPRGFRAFWIASSMLILVAACNDGSPPTIVGVVCTEPDIVSSIAYRGALNDGRCRPISGARIVLAFDVAGDDIIPGFETKSDLDGNYRIEMRNLPRAKQAWNTYTLSISKESYEPLTIEVSPAPLSRFRQNTIVLKKIEANNQ